MDSRLVFVMMPLLRASRASQACRICPETPRQRTACSGSAAPPLVDRHVSHREAQMVTRTLVSAVVASLFIAGCASMKPTDFSPRPSAKECNGSGNCTVSVSVVDLSIRVDPEFVIFNNRRGDSIKFKWEIQTAGYAIDTSEIPDGGGAFAECGP